LLGTNPATVASFRLRDLDSGTHESLLSPVTVLGDGGRELHIQAQKHASGQARWHLLENRNYKVTFDTTASNPKDVDGNPLDLAGTNPLVFNFSTATLPRIDFFSSTIGTKRIRATDDANKYQLPSGTLSNASTVLDLKLKFSKALDLP